MSTQIADTTVSGAENDPFRSLALRYFKLSGFVVLDHGELVEVIDAGGEALRLTSNPQGADESGMQYLGPGSMVMERVMNELRNRGRLIKLYGRFAFNERSIQGEIRQRFNAELHEKSVSFSGTSISFQPVLLMNFKISYLTDEKQEEISTNSVNLYTGEFLDDFIQNIGRIRLTENPPLVGLVRRRISLSKAYETIRARLIAHIAGKDKKWMEDANRRLGDELQQLESYYGNIILEPDENLIQEKERRIIEQKRKFTPRVSVELINGGIIYVPHLVFDVSLSDPMTMDRSEGRIDIDAVSGRKVITGSEEIRSVACEIETTAK